MADDDPTLRELASPLRPAALRPLGKQVERIQIGKPLKPADVPAAAAFVAKHPKTWLRIYSPGDKAVDLRWLQDVPGVRKLWLDLPPDTLIDYGVLESLPAGLTGLYLPETKRRIQGMERLARFRGLTDLALSGNVPDIDVVAGLKSLRALTLFRTKVTSLDALAGLAKLRTLTIEKSAVEQWDVLPRLPALRELLLKEARGAADLAVVGRCAQLTRLDVFFCRLAGALPDLAPMKALQFLRLTGPSPAATLADLWRAPALKSLLFEPEPKLGKDTDFAALPQHPTLRHVHLGIYKPEWCKQIGTALGVKCHPYADEMPYPD
jgi:hypothetical protein